MKPLVHRCVVGLCCLLLGTACSVQSQIAVDSSGPDAFSNPDVSSGPQPATELQPFLLGGIQTHEKDHQRWMAALRQSGMNAVQATVYAHQGPWNSSKLWYDVEQPFVLEEIRAARQNGLQVVLILRVALNHNEPANRFLWHGLTYPASEQATKEWFQTYTDFVLKWARIAEQEGVEVLGIASEMNSLAATLPVEEIPHLPAYYLDDESQERLRTLVGRSQHLFSEELRVGMGAGDFTSLDDFLVERNQAERAWARTYIFENEDDPIAAMNRRRRLLDSHWRRLVEQVRQAYSGRLTLAANFDNYHEVSFWDALDIIGINAYFPLRASLETPLSEDGLADEWREIFDGIEAFKETHELSQEVLFTELGYTRRQGVTIAPWSSSGFIPLWDPEGEVERDRAFFWANQPIVPSERALAMQALHRVWTEGRADLAGILYWKLSSLIDLQRFEPFMLYLGDRGNDPSFRALTRFAEGIRPLSPLIRDDSPYPRAVDAILRNDREALRGLGPAAMESSKPDQPPLLHLAVGLGRSAITRYLLDQGARPDQRDAAGFLPLHWTCYQDDPELVSLLLPADRGPWRDAQGETPLMKCARLSNSALTGELLAHQDPSINVRNGHQQSALHLAVSKAPPPMIQAMIEAGAEVDEPDASGMTPLHLAARRGDLEVIKVLIKHSLGQPNAEGNRPVAEAAIYGQGDVFHLLFEPSRVHEVNVYGQTLLHLAAHGGDLRILETLLDHFPQVDPQDHDGWAPLAFATRNGQLKAVELLLKRGASIELRNGEGTSVLQLAGRSYEPRLLQLLVAEDINVDLADSGGNTALHHSAGWGYVENVRILLQAGADHRLRNGDGETPLEVAEGAARHRVVELLRSIQATLPQSER